MRGSAKVSPDTEGDDSGDLADPGERPTPPRSTTGLKLRRTLTHETSRMLGELACACRQRRIDAPVLHRIPEGRVDLVIAAGLGLYRPGLEHQMPAKGPRIDARLFQRLLDAAVAFSGLRIIKPRPIDRPRPGLRDQLLQHRKRIAPAQHKLAGFVPQRPGKAANPQTQTPLRRGGKCLNKAIVDENRDHRTARLCRGM